MPRQRLVMPNHIKNRLALPQVDYILAIVRCPAGWKPTAIDAIPPHAEILSEDSVASFEEARDDRTRCNSLCLRHQLNRWAVILHPGSDI